MICASASKNREPPYLPIAKIVIFDPVAEFGSDHVAVLAKHQRDMPNSRIHWHQLAQDQLSRA
jgi:hypothetical protein